MAIGAIFNSLIYGGVDSADYGVYITGDAVFNAPKRSVELVSVPGRNGAIEIDQGHFENIEVSYPAGMFGDDKTDFRERLSDFRNAIMSQKGYQRLSDTYHPDEFRMGIYVDGLDVEPIHYNEAGQFTLKFNCKPQRWLTSGEEPIDVMDFHGETYEDNAPYLLRRSAGGETSVPFDMEKDTLIGGSIAWNQLVRYPQFENGLTFNSGTSTISSGVATCTANGNGNAYALIYIRPTDLPLANHVIFLACDVKLDTGNASDYPSTLIMTSWSGGSKAVSNAAKGTWKAIATVVKPTGAPTSFALYPFGTETTPSGEKVDFKKPIYVDLTAFNSEIAEYVYSLEQATAGTGVAWLKEHFPKLFDEYHAYDTGSLVSVKTSEHRTVGFNQWDEVWEEGTYADGSGAKISYSNRIRNKNFIPILPNTPYFFRWSNSGNYLRILYYDANKEYLGIERGLKDSQAWNAVYTTPSDAYYMNFAFVGTNISTYNHDICINISKTTGTPKNGDYVAYESHSYPLDSDLELRGKFYLDANNNLRSDGDVYPPSGEVSRKYALFNLGSINWYQHGSDVNAYYSTTSSWNIPKKSIDLLCAKYITVNAEGQVQNMPDKSLTADGSTDNYLYIKDSVYTSNPSGLKNSLDGIYLLYPLATPTTETADPFASPQIVDPNGTEEYVDERSVPVPVGHRTVYGMDPSVLVNPTLFDAGPLLAVEGHGEIGFNGHTIILSDVPFGDIVLHQAGEFATSLGSIDFNPDLVDTGDTISIDNVTHYIVTDEETSFPDVTVISESGYANGDAVVEQSVVGVDLYSYDIFITMDDISFAVGTATTLTYMATIKYSNSWTETYEAEISYDGDHTISFGTHTTGGDEPTYFEYPIDFTEITTESSESVLGHPTYIDCEMGEAYKIEEGEVISLNRYIDLGSNLPVLSPGENTVTYDNTITELTVEPRWWKI